MLHSPPFADAIDRYARPARAGRGAIAFDPFDDPATVRSDDIDVELAPDGSLAGTRTDSRRPTRSNLADRLSNRIFSPLAVVQANVDLMPDLLMEIRRRASPSSSIDALLDELDTMLEEVQVCTRRIGDAVRGFQRLTSARSGFAATWRCRPVELRAVVEGALAEVKPTLTARARVQIEVEPALRVSADPAWLRRALAALLTNAFECFDGVARPCPTIRISAEVTVDERCVVRVVDHGPGIPAHLATEIFEPYFTTRSNGKHTGLGLTTARALVERMGGRLVHPATTGPGTEMRLELDLAERARGDQPSAPMQELVSVAASTGA